MVQVRRLVTCTVMLSVACLPMAARIFAGTWSMSAGRRWPRVSCGMAGRHRAVGSSPWAGDRRQLDRERALTEHSRCQPRTPDRWA